MDLYQPEILWSDGEFDAHSDYWKVKEFIAWLYNESPVNSTVVINDRWGNGENFIDYLNTLINYPRENKLIFSTHFRNPLQVWGVLDMC